MNKLATIISGFAVVVIGWLVPLESSRAAPPATEEITMWDTTGDWTGSAEMATPKGYFKDVPVTLHISDQQLLTTVGPMGDQNYLFVHGTLAVGPCAPMRLAASLDLSQGNTTMQGGKFTVVGDLFTGEIDAMSMTMNGTNTITATGSITFVGDGTTLNPPAVVKLGLTKQ
ncbi:MAG: hypothetical protein ACLPXB_03165 [Thiobacillaceae bacterium]